MTTYKIIRNHFKTDKELIKTGLTLEEAQDHCHDPETSSETCTNNNLPDPWFDSYSEE